MHTGHDFAMIYDPLLVANAKHGTFKGFPVRGIRTTHDLNVLSKYDFLPDPQTCEPVPAQKTINGLDLWVFQR